MLDEKNISRAARRKMAQRARKTAKKRANKRKITAKRMKNSGQLKASSQRAAKNLLVKKMTGGKSYGSLSVGQKEMIDKKLAKKPGLVNKVARKILPKIKAKEKERVKKVRAKLTELGESKSDGTHGVYTLNKSAGEAKVSARYIDGKLSPYTFTNRTQAKKHANKVGGKVFKTPSGRAFYVEFTKLDGPVNEYVGPKYKTANEIKKQWKKEYPTDKFTFKKVRAKGNDWLLVLSPKGVELERYQHVPKTGWIEMNESKDNEEDLKSLKSMLDIAQLLSTQSPYFKGRGSKKEYIKMLLHKIKKLSENHEHFLEIIKVPIEIGDTVLGGKFKNKKTVVKSIEKNEKGDITINKKPLLKYRITKQSEGKSKKKKPPISKLDAYKQVRKTTMPKSRPMKSKKAYDRKDYKKGKYD